MVQFAFDVDLTKSGVSYEDFQRIVPASLQESEFGLTRLDGAKMVSRFTGPIGNRRDGVIRGIQNADSRCPQPDKITGKQHHQES